MPSSSLRYRRQVLRLVWLQLIGMYSNVLDMPLCDLLIHSLTVSTSNAHFVSLDDDCLVPPETMALFLKRIFRSFGLHPDDSVIQFLKNELKELLHYNTDLKGKNVYSSNKCSLHASYATHCAPLL